MLRMMGGGDRGASAMFKHERISFWIGGASYVTTYKALGGSTAVDAEVSGLGRVALAPGGGGGIRLRNG